MRRDRHGREGQGPPARTLPAREDRGQERGQGHPPTLLLLCAAQGHQPAPSDDCTGERLQGASPVPGRGQAGQDPRAASTLLQVRRLRGRQLGGHLEVPVQRHLWQGQMGPSEVPGWRQGAAACGGADDGWGS